MGKATTVLKDKRQAREQLSQLLERPDTVVVIHYSCESFYDRKSETSARITSIAVSNFHTGQANSFSIHRVAEEKGVLVNDIEANYNELERLMLDQFYDYVRSHPDYKWLHWNMRNIMYGFRAIAHRYKVLGGIPVDIHDSNLVDLANLLQKIYGENYAQHQRLEYLMHKNRITGKDFLTGKEEAIAFENKEYVRLHYSTMRKVEVIAALARRHDQGVLKTDTSWRDQYAYEPQAFAEWLSQHWFAQLLLWLFALIGFFASVVQIWQFLRP
jgi:hypothetical protein